MNILVGISGGIAAYKTPDLVRRLVERGFSVRVMMTEAATAFIGELSLQAVSGNPVHTKIVDPDSEAAMGHIELARWADAIVIAPATANTIAKLAHGLADNLLTTVVLASEAPVYIAPAMNQQMWHHPATQENIKTLSNTDTLLNIEKLKARQVTMIGPAAGDQACGEVGLGRMEEPDRIAEFLLERIQKSDCALKGKHVYITAGPTVEAVDPVRYLSNHSSGKMGFALAEMAARSGAEVTLISGPVKLDTPVGVTRLNVTSATDMHECVMQHVGEMDVFIGCAAVADYRPGAPASQKLKKNDDQLVLTIVKNPDIITDVAGHPDRPFCVGFAAETQQVEAHGREKLVKKGLDMICINDVSNPEIGFNSDENQLVIFMANNDDSHTINKSSKMNVAREIIQLIEQQL